MAAKRRLRSAVSLLRKKMINWGTQRVPLKRRESGERHGEEPSPRRGEEARSVGAKGRAHCLVRGGSAIHFGPAYQAHSMLTGCRRGSGQCAKVVDRSQASTCQSYQPMNLLNPGSVHVVPLVARRWRFWKRLLNHHRDYLLSGTDGRSPRRVNEARARMAPCHHLDGEYMTVPWTPRIICAARWPRASHFRRRRRAT